jgi:hypothetical protein
MKHKGAGMPSEWQFQLLSTEAIKAISSGVNHLVALGEDF